jgi:hypothetical protein
VRGCRCYLNSSRINSKRRYRLNERVRLQGQAKTMRSAFQPFAAFSKQGVPPLNQGSSLLPAIALVNFDQGASVRRPKIWMSTHFHIECDLSVDRLRTGLWLVGLFLTSGII